MKRLEKHSVQKDVPPRVGQRGKAAAPLAHSSANKKSEFLFSPRVQNLWLGLILVTATFLAYLPVWHAGFIWDDDSHITANPALRSLKGLWDIWFQPGATCQYYPLTFTGFWIGYHLWGMNPLGYHLATLTLHGVVAVLLWQVLKRLEVRAAWLAGAIFALHPVNVMSVAWATELKNTLSGALILGTAWAYLRFAGLGVYATAVPERKNWRYGLLSLSLFQLAMFAKTAVSFFPVTILLLVWWKRGRIVWRDVWPLLGMFGIIAGLGLLTLHVEHLHGAAGDQFRMSLPERLLVSGRSFWFYLGKLFFPYPLTFIYERWKIDAGAVWQYAYPAATLGLFGGLWLLRRRIGKGALVALSHFYIATSLLVLIQVLYMMRYTFVTDHWQYFGCMSVFALAAAGMDVAFDFCKLGRLPLKRVFYGILLATLGVMTWKQCRMYEGVETIWRTTLARNPNSWLAQNNLGDVLLQQKQWDEAMVHINKAIEIEPGFPEAYNELGSALLQTGQTDEAILQLRRALAIKPDFSEAQNNLGNALFRKGRTDEAILEFQRALAIQPDNAEAHNNLGAALLQSGQVDEAIMHLQSALAINPEYAEAHYNLGNALFQKGQTDTALVQFQRALTIQPDNLNALNNLATILLQKERMDEAMVHLQHVLAIQPDNVAARNNLGTALFQKGRVDEAILQFQRALAIQPGLEEAQISLTHVAWVLATSPELTVRNGTKALALARQTDQLSGGTNPVMAATLAAAYAEAGRFPEAIATAGRAARLAASQNNAALVATIEAQLKLYQAGSPCRDDGPAQ